MNYQAGPLGRYSNGIDRISRRRIVEREVVRSFVMTSKTDRPKSLTDGHVTKILARNVGPSEQAKFAGQYTLERFLDDLESGKGTPRLLIKERQNPRRNRVIQIVPGKSRKRK